MIGYVTLGTNDLARGARFYDAIAAEMGVGRMMEFESFIAWGAPGGAPGGHRAVTAFVLASYSVTAPSSPPTAT